MRGEIGAAALAALLAISGLMILNSPDIAEGIPSRNNFGTHNSGNFSIIIDDNGGYTAWSTLEFPIGQNRLTKASFGLGSTSSMVDYGSRGDLTTVSSLKIVSPGSFTDEEGTCSFSGWAGQDFEEMLVTQTTFMNDYTAGKAGHGGRWLVVDYNLSSSSSFGDILAIQMMDVDLGIATDDLFEYDPITEMTVIHQGTTYIGLAPYRGNFSYVHGHNAGTMSPDIFDGEDKIYAHMANPNNASTSLTAQNWYMDQIVRIPSGSFPGQFRIAFIIAVGDSISSLREAYIDATEGLTSTWSGSAPDEWLKGNVDLSADFEGPIWPPENITVTATPVVEGTKGSPRVLDHSMGNETLSFSADTENLVPTWGCVELTVTSLDVWGFPTNGYIFTIKCDNQKPTVSFGKYPLWQSANYQVVATSSDGGGSGIATTYISANGESFRPSTIATIQTEGSSSVKAYAVDNVGNVGNALTISNLGLDKTPPTIGAISFAPSDINEDTSGAVKISTGVTDTLSGVNMSAVEFRFGLDKPTSQWIRMSKEGSKFEGKAVLDWNAAQGKQLVAEIRAADICGNLRNITGKETIDQVNDPPAYTMKLTAEEWEGDSIIIDFSGSDPDGDEPNFEIRYKLEGSDWTHPGNLLKKLSTTKFSMVVPNTTYEGKLYVHAIVTDGEDPVEIPHAFVTIDNKPPTLTTTIDPAGYWSRTARTVTSNAKDGGSGIDIFWFDLDGVKMSGKSLSVKRDGLHSVKAFVVDKAGNEAKFDLPAFGIDATPPTIGAVTVPQGEILDSDEIKISWTMSDATSGIAQFQANLSSQFLPTEYTVNGDIHTARFAPVPGGVYAFSIKVTDKAQNVAVHDGSLEVVTTEAPPPIDFTIPDSVNVGKTFTITAEGSDRIILHVLYPGRSVDWIVDPVRTEGDLHTFTLQGPYAYDRDIEVWFEYGAENETYPEPHETIEVTGGADRDGDGLEDSWEEKYHYDASRKDKTSLDRDGDGLSAISEMRNLTNPAFWDTDGDDMDDAWESRWGTLPFVADADIDLDKDGYSNSFEKERGTDPRDSGSIPKKLPPTPWYWILIITAVLLGIIGFFGYQLLSRRKLEKELESFGNESWDEEPDHPRSR